MSDYYRPQTKLRESNVFTGVCSGVLTGGGRDGVDGRGVYNPYPGDSYYISTISLWAVVVDCELYFEAGIKDWEFCPDLSVATLTCCCISELP